MWYERGHSHGGAENSLRPTCLDAFFKQHLEDDVKPPGSTFLLIVWPSGAYS